MQNILIKEISMEEAWFLDPRGPPCMHRFTFGPPQQAEARRSGGGKRTIPGGSREPNRRVSTNQIAARQQPKL